LVLFQLTEQIRTLSSQSPIILAINDAPVGAHAVFSGWGKIYPSGYMAKILQKHWMPIIDNVACQKLYKNITILNSQVCTFEKKGVGACKVSKDSCSFKYYCSLKFVQKYLISYFESSR